MFAGGPSELPFERDKRVLPTAFMPAGKPLIVLHGETKGPGSSCGCRQIAPGSVRKCVVEADVRAPCMALTLAIGSVGRRLNRTCAYDIQ